MPTFKTRWVVLTLTRGRDHPLLLLVCHGPTSYQVIPRIHAAAQPGAVVLVAHVAHLLVARLERRPVPLLCIRIPRQDRSQPSLRPETHGPGLQYHWIVRTPLNTCSAQVLTTRSAFLLFNTILEALMWASHRRERVGTTDPEKDRPLTTTTGTTTAGTANGGAPTTTI